MLTVEGLVSGYGRTRVLHGISLTIPDSGIVAVLGHNGAGKTTLMKTIVGLVRATQGTIRWNNEDITRLAPHQRVKRGIAYVPQGQQSFGQLTALENMELVAGTDRGRKGLISEMMDRFPDLREYSSRRAELLSGGQRQQLAIARALLTRPKLLILDEPGEGIQPSIVADIRRTMLDLAGDGIQVLLVEQQIDFAVSHCAHYVVVASGRIVDRGEGGPDSVGQVRNVLTI
ncbi:MAG: ATP-binding cassette domain-containing protein [Propionibacterium sp.]